MWRGPNYLDGYKLDRTDANVLRDVSFIDEVLCEARHGDDVGYGIIELVIVGKYPKYGYKDWGLADPEYIAGNVGTGASQ